MDLISASVREPSQQLFWTFTFAAAGATWWRGSRPERLAAAGVTLNFILSALVAGWTIRGVWVGVMALDLALLALLYGLTLRWPRWWAIGCAGFVLSMVIAHLVAMFAPGIWRWPYATMHWLLSAGVVMSLAFGALEGRWAMIWEGRRLSGDRPNDPFRSPT